MRTDAEVTAAAERTADLALRCVRLTAERDRARDIAVALEGQVAALEQRIEDTCLGCGMLDADEGWSE